MSRTKDREGEQRNGAPLGRDVFSLGRFGGTRYIGWTLFQLNYTTASVRTCWYVYTIRIPGDARAFHAKNSRGAGWMRERKYPRTRSLYATALCDRISAIVPLINTTVNIVDAKNGILNEYTRRERGSVRRIRVYLLSLRGRRLQQQTRISRNNEILELFACLLRARVVSFPLGTRMRH